MSDFLDPTHVAGKDITGSKAIETTGWVLPCDPELHYGLPCDCQEGVCEGRVARKRGA